MNINNNTNSIQVAIQKINHSAKKIAKINAAKDINLAKELSEQIIFSNEIKANTLIIKTKDELFKVLLDLKA